MMDATCNSESRCPCSMLRPQNLSIISDITMVWVAPALAFWCFLPGPGTVLYIVSLFIAIEPGTWLMSLRAGVCSLLTGAPEFFWASSYWSCFFAVRESGLGFSLDRYSTSLAQLSSSLPRCSTCALINGLRPSPKNHMRFASFGASSASNS